MAAAAALSLPTPPTAAATDAVTDKAGASTSTAELLDAHDTTLTACALEMCSWPPPSRDEKSSSGCCWVVCGTYQLVKAAEAGGEDRREGSLLLYQLGGGEGQKRKRRLTPRQAVALKEEGVLDCKWCVLCVRACGHRVVETSHELEDYSLPHAHGNNIPTGVCLRPPRQHGPSSPAPRRRGASPRMCCSRLQTMEKGKRVNHSSCRALRPVPFRLATMHRRRTWPWRW